MTHLNPYMIELDISHLNLHADYFIERELIRDDISNLNLPMNYFTALELRRDKVMRELEQTFQYHRKRWRQLYHDPDTDTIYIQPSYKPYYMKGLKGKPILVFLKEDGDLDIILDEQNWENYCEIVRGDYLDYFCYRDFYPSNMCFHDEKENNEKEKKRNNAFLQNVLAQRDASNYLTVHENKRIINDVSNHILSFF